MFLYFSLSGLLSGECVNYPSIVIVADGVNFVALRHLPHLKPSEITWCTGDCIHINM